MIRRVRIFVHKDTNKVQGKLMPIRDWVRYKVHENIENIVYKDDFSAIFCRNREKGAYVVYAHTHRDAQKAMRKYFNNPLTVEAYHE